MKPGKRTMQHPWVGDTFAVLGFTGDVNVGVCISVTPWGSDRIRWVWLRHNDGSKRAYAPSQLRRNP